jgi:hypothetical protein
MLSGFLALMSVLPAMGQSPDFTLCNGTGQAITEIEIRPSRELYRGNANVFALQGLSVQDKQALAIFLPTQYQGITAFDVVLKYDSKTAKTKEAMMLTENMGTYVAYIKGKSSTLPIIAGGVAGGTTAAGIGAMAPALSAGMVVGTAGFGIFSLVNLLTADTLILANVQ